MCVLVHFEIDFINVCIHFELDLTNPGIYLIITQSKYLTKSWFEFYPYIDKCKSFTDIGFDLIFLKTFGVNVTVCYEFLSGFR